MATFTLVHVVISLIGLGSGFVVMTGFFSAKRLDGWTSIFLTSTALTSVTGFLFPFHKFMPSYVVAGLSLVILAIAIVARYVRHLEGGWRTTYVVTSMIAFYFNCFVLVAQLFAKVPALKALAPTQSEPPFAIAQGILMLLFIWLSIRAVKGFRGLQTPSAALKTAS